MTEDSNEPPAAVPTNHGRFEGPATEQDYTEALEMSAKDLAQLKFQERQGRVELSQNEKDKYDEITGLPYGAHHRKLVNEKLQKLNPNERRALIPNNALIVNLDGKGLKNINDTLGHENGNIMLHNIAQILKAVARPGDIVGKWGESGDEFSGVFFFRDDQIEPEEMKKAIDERLLFLTEYAVENNQIGGLRWSSTFFEPGKDFRYHLSRAEPVESINPGNVIEFPSREILPGRDEYRVIAS
jgi:diguanylate cyclase (GGDEF)-like protein